MSEGYVSKEEQLGETARGQLFLGTANEMAGSVGISFCSLGSQHTMICRSRRDLQAWACFRRCHLHNRLPTYLYVVQNLLRG